MPLDESILILLKKYVPDFHPSPVEKEFEQGVWTSLDLPMPQVAEYGIRLHEAKDHIRQITAYLKESNSDSKEYFWYVTLEKVDFKTTKDLDFQFSMLVEILLSHETRIEQRKGLMFWKFDCQFHHDGQWHTVGGNSCFRPSFDVPKIFGRSKIYSSPALSTVKAAPDLIRAFKSKRTHSVDLG